MKLDSKQVTLPMTEMKLDSKQVTPPLTFDFDKQKNRVTCTDTTTGFKYSRTFSSNEPLGVLLIHQIINGTITNYKKNGCILTIKYCVNECNKELEYKMYFDDLNDTEEFIKNLSFRDYLNDGLEVRANYNFAGCSLEYIGHIYHNVSLTRQLLENLKLGKLKNYEMIHKRGGPYGYICDLVMRYNCYGIEESITIQIVKHISFQRATCLIM